MAHPLAQAGPVHRPRARRSRADRAGAEQRAGRQPPLHITEATVKRHLTNIYAKLGAASRVDAIRKAATAKLIDSRLDPATD